MEQVLLSFLVSLVASLVAVVVVLLVERRSRPRLEFEIEPVPPIMMGSIDTQKAGRKHLRVLVWNRPTAGWLHDRQPAMMCRGRITFLKEDCQPVFHPGRSMMARWADSPEPLRPIQVSDASIALMPDPYETWDDMDIAPGDKEILDVVMRREGQDECAGWSNSYILHSFGVQPPLGEAFVLPKGRYLVLIVMKTGGRNFHRFFRIVNDMGYDEFRLDELPKQPSLPKGIYHRFGSSNTPPAMGRPEHAMRMTVTDIESRLRISAVSRWLRVASRWDTAI